ncbi:hypothetical protein FXO38_08672 [Capsicum annuum]|nr:hypothetical protein FXO38_08672 [Capsicum annuum]KAF3669595.1 hypothetical protein FXO37_08937 [Capsicum annuum]
MNVASDEEIEHLSVDVASNSSRLLPSNLIDIIVDSLESKCDSIVELIQGLHKPCDGQGVGIENFKGVNEIQEQNVPILEDAVKFKTCSQICAKLQSEEIDVSIPPDDLLSRKRKWCKVSDEVYGPSFTLISPTSPVVSDHIFIKDKFVWLKTWKILKRI